MSAGPIKKRVRELEARIVDRRASLSSARRRILTDRAVRDGDAQAAAELARARRSTPMQATPEQREAAIAAAMRADQ
jgi:hypothetical protein